MSDPRVVTCQPSRRFGLVWGAVLAVVGSSGCVRFPTDATTDASLDGGGADVSADLVDASAIDGSSELTDAPSDAPEAAPPPVCQRFDPSIAQTVASDLVSGLLQDCRINRAFSTLPPVRLQHLQECLAAQLASVLGCLHTDGTRYKYPAFDSKGEFCRDMKTAHAAQTTTSDGDFDAFLADISAALNKNGMTSDEVARVTKVYGNIFNRNDIVRRKDAGPSQPCDGGGDFSADADTDARGD